MAKNWTEDEQILALNLYHLLTFGRLDRKTPEIISLAKLMDRTPSSLSMKLCNFASLDPEITKDGRKGLANVSNKDREIWAWHVNKPIEFQQKSKKLADNLDHNIYFQTIVSPEVTEKQALVTTRIGQSFFRKMVLENYNSKCCFSGVSTPSLLVASHIVPWAKDDENRLNPKNGLCLSAIHDRAFDQGFWTIGNHGEIIISKELKKDKSEMMDEMFFQYEGKSLTESQSYVPSIKFIEFHQQYIYEKWLQK
ncbi:MAG: HNH endonuclease [Oleibacter sp.]|nr:HNH endonuclease [Thalassolituus sp.]